MEELSSESVKLFAYLLPGFAAAWLFYGLTSHPKPSQFERVVQALIFTFVVQVLLLPIRGAALMVGRVVDLGSWTQASEMFSSLILAIGLGAALAFFTNNDLIHGRLRKLGFTSRTSHPSEWYCVFAERAAYVILQLKDGRRLYGWPKEWPITPDHGQIYIQAASWIDETGNVIDLPELDGVLISTKDVDWVEFMREGEQSNDK